MSDLGLNILPIAFGLGLIILLGIVAFKMFVRKQDVSPRYTPFDEITGNTARAFYEEKELKEEQKESGDDDEPPYFLSKKK
ncbi:DUF3951 domain-containing protein [Brevibacillus daliensis]|uniref:DUF3951 domain-containing protein n=1 Tax=Brevibacillus daliensis TaxID=2892995 RepID=UPI001E3B3A65|nr:DUF3951 domain-containing protein [Brevibacillus daliensis]